MAEPAPMNEDALASIRALLDQVGEAVKVFADPLVSYETTLLKLGATPETATALVVAFQTRMMDTANFMRPQT